MEAAQIVRYDHIDGPELIPWKEIHQVRDRGMLSGSQPSAVLKYHHIGASELSGKAVIDVGVGLGVMDHRLWSMVATRVIGVDIVAEALVQLEGRTERYLVEDLPIKSPADCAICHLVMQHCSDDLAAKTLEGLWESLRPGGWLSVQFGGSTGPVPGDRGDVVWREQEVCYKMCQDAGFKVYWNCVHREFGAVEWYVFRCRR